ncbi:MAG: hypothetical protein ACJAVO_001665 [Parvibaculaceae bacterium]|jgi:hypothetical protein|nr:hypothetical protein [Parvibaculaceae bacterium]
MAHLGMTAKTALKIMGFSTFLGLAACGASVQAENEMKQRLPCPGAGILGSTEKVTVFNGAGQDITDVVVTAEIERVVTSCEYDFDDGIIYVDVAYRGIAEAGPAATSPTINVPVFLALTEVNRSVLRKDVEPIVLDFSAGGRRTDFVKVIEGARVPYVPPFDGAAYEYLVGFQLTPDQVAYNKAQKADR